MKKSPPIHDTAFVHSSAVVLGDVTVGEHSSIWPGVILRGDINHIKIGRFTNIQDLTLCHVDLDAPCEVGDYVVCGHQATLHGCRIGDQCLIGIGAVILSHAVVGPNVIVGAHGLVPEGKMLEEGYVYYGSPVKKIRPIELEERVLIRKRCEDYAKLAAAHRRGEFVSFPAKG